MMRIPTDVEVQLDQLQEDIKLLEELLNNIPAMTQRLNKLKQRRNQMQLLVDIHHGKLRLHRTDTDQPIQVQFNR